MLAITIFSTIIGDMLPVSENTPLIGQHLNSAFHKFKSNLVLDDIHHKLGQNPNHVALITTRACFLNNFSNF